jgi:hypothetical protein
MTILQDIPAAANWQTRVGENFRSVSPAGLYGINPATSTGLTWGYLGGNFSGVSVANGTVALAASSTNYVVAHRTTGVVSVATTTTNWLNAAVYLQLYQIVVGTSTVTSYDDMRQAFGAAVASAFTGGTMTSAINEAPTVTIASAGTVNIGAAAGNSISITGTTTITAFDTIAAGATRRMVFAGALTLTHNATSLILPSGASITTAAGDVAEFLSLGSGNWRCIGYARATGAPLASGAASGLTITSQSAAYTLVLGDANTGILHPSADTTARTWTIPANSSVAYPVGTALTFINQNAAGVLTIAITTDTMRLAGAGTTGSRTLAANGTATAMKLTSTEWIIIGGSSLT